MSVGVQWPWWALVRASWISAGVRGWRQVWKLWRSLRLARASASVEVDEGLEAGVQALDDVGVGLGEVG